MKSPFLLALIFILCLIPDANSEDYILQDNDDPIYYNERDKKFKDKISIKFKYYNFIFKFSTKPRRLVNDIKFKIEIGRYNLTRYDKISVHVKLAIKGFVFKHGINGKTDVVKIKFFVKKYF